MRWRKEGRRARVGRESVGAGRWLFVAQSSGFGIWVDENGEARWNNEAYGKQQLFHTVLYWERMNIYLRNLKISSTSWQRIAMHMQDLLELRRAFADPNIYTTRGKTDILCF